MPLTDETRHMLDARRLALCKKGVRIVNCARGGLIDESALGESLKSGQVGAAALDVYEIEPPPADWALRELPNLVMTPHLGASTAEAQESVGIEVAQQIRAALIDGEIRNAVNAPSIDAKTRALIGPHLELAAKLGRFLSQIAPKRAERLNINYSGKLIELDTKPITLAVLKGYLQTIGGNELNEVNAPSLAESLGLKITESRESTMGDYAELIEVSAGDGEKASVAGTFFGATPRIVRINESAVEARPEGVLLLLENRDRPGMVGLYGSLLGKHKVNIAGMSLSRDAVGGRALVVLNLDAAPGQDVLNALTAEEDIHTARVIQL
jgi:D-3-phosphoglycerate dehydrogenase